MTVLVRREGPADAAAIGAVHQAAFPGDAEARLVDALRAAGNLAVSLVAVADGVVVGHIAFSPVTVDGQECGGLGLAPMAVTPAWQRCGVGSALVRDGLTACVFAGARFVVVLGWPDYYPRFGFTRADAVGLANEYGATDAFLVRALGKEPLPAGLVRYGPEFAAFD